MKMLPNTKPKLTQSELLGKIKHFNIDRIKYPVIVVGIRGYYAKSMGINLFNERGIYDDAMMIDSPSLSASYNANTDPSVKRSGIAVLVAGAIYLYKIGMHNMKNPYKALRQFGRVTVLRDGNPTPITDTTQAPFYIDVHKGGYGTTSSLGCQTIYPTQWDSFLASVESELKRYNQTVIPYVLIEN